MKTKIWFGKLWNRRVRSVTQYAAVVGLAAAAEGWAGTIQSIQAEPAPLVVGGLFNIKVQASPDVTVATAAIEVRRANVLRMPLVKSGEFWTAQGMIPVDLGIAGTVKGTITVHAFDSSRQPSQKSVSIQVAALPFNWATFDPATGVLTITGDNGNNMISASRDANGNIVVNGGALAITGGVPTAANTTLIRVFAFDGNDEVILEQSSGFPRGELYGGPGNDSLFGGGGADTILGGPGDDALLGRLGIDILMGEEGADTLTGGDGNDALFAGPGADALVWNPGDDSDTLEGGGEQDTLVFHGANVGEMIGVSANGHRLSFTRDIAAVALDANDVEVVQFNALGGADNITVGDLSGTDVTAVNLNLAGFGGTGDGLADSVTMVGTTGNDEVVVTGSGSTVGVSGLSTGLTITGSEIAFDKLIVKTLEGSDHVDASGLELDVIQLSAEGGAESDTLTVAAAEGVSTDVFANAARLNLYRGAQNPFEADDVENVVIHGTGEPDSIVVGDLTGTDVTEMVVDLFDPEHPDMGDGQVDSVQIFGTQGNDMIAAQSTGAELLVNGLSATVKIAGGESAHDRLIIHANGGEDVVNASALAGGMINLNITGGLGIDLITGSAGNDMITGGDGNDVFVGGPGDDTFVWNPGDDSDVVEGQEGTDTLLFNGSNAGETIALTANGNRLTFTRDIATVTIDTDDVEEVLFVARGGEDKITVNDLSTTDVKTVELDLFGSIASMGDSAADVVTLHGTAGNDDITLIGNSDGVTVSGLSAELILSGTELSYDQLRINTHEGDDGVDASGVMAGLMQLIVDGGADNDTLVGSEEIDALLGGLGDDVLIGGPGVDLLDGGLGNNVVIQD